MHVYVAYSIESKIYTSDSPATAEGSKERVESLLKSFANLLSWPCGKGGTRRRRGRGEGPRPASTDVNVSTISTGAPLDGCS